MGLGDLPGEVDLLVIGAGAGGVAAAREAARLGASVLVAEPARVGGRRIWSGVVPRRALRRAGELGRAFDDAMADALAARERVASAWEAALGGLDGVRLVAAAGELRGDGIVALRDAAGSGDLATMRARHIIIASGSGRAEFPASWTDPDEVTALRGRLLTADSLWRLRSLPARVVIVGGGVDSMEIAHALAVLGSAVVVLAPSERLLPQLDDVAADALRIGLERRDVEIVTGVEVLGLRGGGVGAAVRVVATPREDGTAREWVADHVLLASRRGPTTSELGLDAADVATDAIGAIIVDHALRTTNHRIHAIGSAAAAGTDHPSAEYQAPVAVRDALLVGRATFVGELVPWEIAAGDGVAHVGLSADAAGRAADGVMITHVGGATADMPLLEHRAAGAWAQIVCEAGGRRVLGVTVGGPHAADQVALAAGVMRRDGSLDDLATVPTPWPSWSGLLQAAARRMQSEYSLPPRMGVVQAVARRVKRR